MSQNWQETEQKVKNTNDSHQTGEVMKDDKQCKGSIEFPIYINKPIFKQYLFK